MNRFASVAALGAGCVLSGAAMANPVTFNGSFGSLSASATFQVTGTTMTVTLTNTSANDVTIPAEVLTAMFFSISGSSPTFAPVSALIASGSGTIYAPFPSGGNVGGEWQYAGGLTPPAPIGALPYGIGSSGLGIFGSPNFGGPNLAGPSGVDGLQFGITSAGDNSGTGNGGITGSGGLIQNSVVFTLSCPQGFDPNTINDVYFLYGTATDEGGFHHPAPGAAALMGLGGLLASRRRR